MMEHGWREHCREMMEPEAPSEPRPPNLLRPGSRCPQCGHAIRAVDNIPVLSYLLLRGRCRDCGTRIPASYPAVELLSGALSVAVAWHFGFGLPALAALLMTWSLVALAGIDVRTQLLPDAITLPLLWAGLALALVPVFADLRSAVLGAMAGYLLLWTVYWLFRLLTRREGMGYGDFKLLAALGGWLGWQALPAILLLSSLVGALTGLGLMLLRGRSRETPIPFGPFLAAAGWLALIWGEQLNRAYLQWAGWSP
jgi:leader peptidase (prepilin peptidase)/N-methyltransferase